MIRGRYGFGGSPVTSSRWGVGLVAVISAIVPAIRRFIVAFESRVFNVRRDP